jgi:hypothetical protein
MGTRQAANALSSTSEPKLGSRPRQDPLRSHDIKVSSDLVRLLTTLVWLLGQLCELGTASVCRLGKS